MIPIRAVTPPHRFTPVFGLALAILYVVGGGLLLTHVVEMYMASVAPIDVPNSTPTGSDTQLVVTLRIHGTARVADVYCVPRSGVSPGVVDVTPDDAPLDFHELCSDEPAAQLYEH
jgi:hypothetical protein